MNQKLWGFALAAFCLSLAPLGQARAEGILMLSGGSTTGTYDYNDSANTFEGWNDELDHDLSGTVSAVGIYFAAENGFLIGAGYNAYSFKGTTSWERDNVTYEGTRVDNISVEFTQTEYSLQGPFAALGLNIKLGDNLRLLPQVRQSQVTASMTEEFTSSITFSGVKSVANGVIERDDQKTTLKVFSLPILIKLNDNLLLGLEAQQLEAEVEFGDSNETVTGVAQTAYLLSLNALF